MTGTAPPPSTGASRAVLVADDSAVAREKLRQVLERSELFDRVLAAADGNEALEVLAGPQADGVDLVLCDMMMPGADGFVLLRRVLDDPRTASIPVIVLTGHEDLEMKIRALQSGAADYLTKPFHDAELLARVRVHANLKRLRDELEEANARLSELVLRDPLTGLANRRQWARRLADEWERSRRHGRPLSVVMADLDHFKRVNDEHGHATGDRVLRAVADTLAGTVRGPDTVARLGGEEFGVLLPETGPDEAVAAAERLRAAVTELELDGDGRPELTIRLSLGTSSVGGDVPHPPEADALVAAADRALYRAKRQGRDRVCSEPVAAPAGG